MDRYPVCHVGVVLVYPKIEHGLAIGRDILLTDQHAPCAITALHAIIDI